jgi:hypothetical protein
MTVSELEELLAMLPEDMPVYLRCFDLGARHIDRVEKQPSRSVRRDIARAIDAGFKGTTVHVNGRHPPALVLEASCRSPLWCHAFGDDVEFTVRGRWPAKPARRP